MLAVYSIWNLFRVLDKKNYIQSDIMQCPLYCKLVWHVETIAIGLIWQNIVSKLSENLLIV